MMRLTVQGGAAIALFFSMVLGAIVVQPHNDTDLRAFFASPECSAPCFLGIRPGETTAEEAIALLQAHPWVKRVSVAGIGSAVRPQNNVDIYWLWNGRQPEFVFDSSSGKPPYLHIYNGVVQYIRLVTRIPYGAAWLIIGAPSSGTLVDGGSSTLQSVGYLDGMLVFDSRVICPVSSSLLWSSPISITFSDGSLPAYSKADNQLDHTVYRVACQS